MIGSELLRYKKDQVYLMIDVESEGLNLNFSRPWQVTWTKANLNGIIEENDYFVWYDDLKVSEQAAIVTGFNHELYKERAKAPKEVLEHLLKDINNSEYRVTGHNLLSFDALIYQILRRTCGLPPDYSFLPRVIDTLALSRAMRKGIKPDVSSPESFLAWQFRMMSIRDKRMKCSLGALGKEFNIEHDEKMLHNALYDLRLNFEVFKKLIWTVEV